MGGGLGPVGGFDVAGAVGEMDFDGEPALGGEGGDDLDGEDVLGGVAEGLDIHGLAIEGEMAEDFAVPQVEGLLDIGEVVGLRGGAVGVGEDEADLAEVQAVGVGAEPGGFGVIGAVGLVAVRNEAAVEVGVFLKMVIG